MRTPRNTYRLQIRPAFDLFEATRRLPYLHALGVDWVYLSPLLTAETASDHGYDVVAHDVVDPSRGGDEGLRALADAAHSLGMGVLVDIVPNHVGVATPASNAWWWDVLRHGRDSVHAPAFDIDWAHGGGRLRLPVLGDEAEPELTVADGDLRYHDHRFPLTPGTEGGSPAEVHARQHYELVNWRVADTGLNYRRFFAVNGLAGLRVEDRDVFERSHAAIRRWFDEGLVDGLRIDHPDGLRHPAAYLDELAGLTGGAYVLVEKILEPGEVLPERWATAGTTGYDALGLVDRVLTDPAGEEPLDALEAEQRGESANWEDLVHRSKRAVADSILGSEVRRVVREVVSEVGVSEEGVSRLASLAPRPTDSLAPRPTEALVDAVAELVAAFPVYRSYLPGGREHLDGAFARARTTRPDLAAAYDVLEPVLADPYAPAALRFQQTSGAVMAKGVEDSAFYRWSRLTSLNEVGGDPSHFAVTVDEFHAAMAERQRDRPEAMTTLSTHDTKRGEDVRARIGVLAEIPDAWQLALERLLELVPLPDPAFGGLLWQAVLGAWPAEPHPDLRDRLHGYAEKAMREAGDRTTWTEPDAAYESAVHAAVDAAFDLPEVREVLDGLLSQVVGPGWSNALAAKLVAITLPGTCDVYQGSELWEQSLVDPDNRRPVDFDLREGLLAAIAAGSQPTLGAGVDDVGAAKLLLTQRALELRRDRPELFTTYGPVAAHGIAAEHVLAFHRGGAITVVTRLPVGLAVGGGWGDTTLDLPEGTWRDELTGVSTVEGVRMADLLSTYPVALLVRIDV